MLKKAVLVKDLKNRLAVENISKTEAGHSS